MNRAHMLSNARRKCSTLGLSIGGALLLVCMRVVVAVSLAGCYIEHGHTLAVKHDSYCIRVVRHLDPPILQR